MINDQAVISNAVKWIIVSKIVSKKIKAGETFNMHQIIKDVEDCLKKYYTE